jgi:hypothetical protein
VRLLHFHPLAGTRQIASAKLISFHVACKTSEVLAQVKMVNVSARDATVLISASRAMNSGN